MYSENNLDCGDTHERKINSKKLDCPPLSGYNHLAVFLRWAYENGLLTDQLLQKEPRLRAAFEGKGDLRKVLANSIHLNGEIKIEYFKKECKKFVCTFYEFCGSNTYPKAVDKYALKYFGRERFNSGEFKDEAYLFVPYDEDYYKNLSKYIDTAWEKYKLAKQSADSTETEDFAVIKDGKFFALRKYIGEKETVVVPDGIYEILSYAFCGIECIKEIVVPDSVMVIRDHAFKDLANLEQIKLPAGILKPASVKLVDCPKAQIIVIGNDVYRVKTDGHFGVIAKTE